MGFLSEKIASPFFKLDPLTTLINYCYIFFSNNAYVDGNWNVSVHEFKARASFLAVVPLQRICDQEFQTIFVNFLTGAVSKAAFVSAWKLVILLLKKKTWFSGIL